MAADISTHGNHPHLAGSTRAPWPPLVNASFGVSTTELLNAIVSPVISTSASTTGGLADVLYTWMANVSTLSSSVKPPISLIGDEGIEREAHSTPPPPPDIEDDAFRLEHAPQLSHSALVKVYVLSVMAILSLLGNILTMWNIYKTRIARRNSRHSWSAIYSLIFHLSIADVLVTGFCIIGEAAWCYTVQWLADELTCKLVKLFQMFSLYLSTYVLVLIGVDRWIAVKYPMKSLNMAKRCYRLLGGTYILSFLLSLPQFFIFHVARGPFIEEFHQCVTHGFYTAEWQEQLYTTFTLVFTFLLPLCILFGTYLSTFRTISSSEKMFQGSKLAAYSTKPSAQTNRQRLIHKAKMKSLRISVVIIIAFLVCWTPYNVMMIIFMFLNPDKRLSEDLHSAIFFFGMSNSLVNPLIYGAFHLCPMRRTASKTGTHNANHSLNRGDSQRTPSMLTAVTQIDNNGRQIRTYHRQSSYYRTQSSGSGGGSCKEHVGLLPVTPTSSLIRKTSSIRAAHYSTNSSHHSHSAYPHHHPHIYQSGQGQQQQPQQKQQHHSHSTSLICKESRDGDTLTEASTSPTFGNAGCNSPLSTVVFTYDTQHGGGVTTAAAKKYSQSQSASALNVLGAAKCIAPNGQGRNGSGLFGSATKAHLDRGSYVDENVSSV